MAEPYPDPATELRPLAERTAPPVLCMMAGSNHQEEKDRRPLYLCPVCLRKLCWNLQAESVPYLTKLKAFYQQNNLDLEGRWYERATAALAPEQLEVTPMKLTCTVSRLAN